jgi:hypothetical protein
VRNDLVKPCDNCPFRNNGNGIKLNPERVRELARTIGRKGHGFSCHKTVEHAEDESGVRPNKHREQVCAGSLAFTLNVGDEMAKTVVFLRLDANPEKLAKIEAIRGEVYESTEAWLRGGTW